MSIVLNVMYDYPSVIIVSVLNFLPMLRIYVIPLTTSHHVHASFAATALRRREASDLRKKGARILD